jgi:hypothetical protein
MHFSCMEKLKIDNDRYQECNYSINGLRLKRIDSKNFFKNEYDSNKTKKSYLFFSFNALSNAFSPSLPLFICLRILAQPYKNKQILLYLIPTTDDFNLQLEKRKIDIFD